MKPILIDAIPTHGRHAQTNYEVGEMVLVNTNKFGCQLAIISEFCTYYDEACVIVTYKDGEDKIIPIRNLSKY